ncbi:tripartite tricarboxylate transporter permease [Lentibacillus jeotgali]|uniref:tripartite tricarboxylate transporter permease n=1 Tax=Lentibacillus jeotgali TaxID=558169 RepID=UPI0002628BD3|nr:tripartite tricarboxylate transporter permease [Lentibacillus jeotgali]
MLGQIAEGFATIITPMNVLLILAGVTAGAILGAIPGLTSTMGIALVLPITFYLEPVAGLSMLIAMYKGGLFGGSVTAIMFNAPGTPAAAATGLDGNPLKKKGYPRKAIRLALISSTTGDLVGNLVLIFTAGLLASAALQFGPTENAALIIFALVLITIITGNSISKNIISVLLGLLIATIGSDPVTSIPRFDFGLDNLSGSISIIALVIGLLAVSEVFETMEQHYYSKFSKSSSNTSEFEANRNNQKKKDDNITIKEVTAVKKTLGRSSIIGTLIGALPGLGPVTATFVSYAQAKSKSKNGDNFGKGEKEGIVAAEAANSAVGSSNLIPLLSLGIPGDATAAIIFGALIIHGIVPGPQLIETNGPIVYGIFAGMLIASAFCFVINWYASNVFRKIAVIRPTVLTPIILVLCIAGTYGYSQASFDIIVMFIFGVLGFLLKKIEIPLVGIVIGFVLGPKLEESFRQVLVLSSGDISIFFTQPISLVLLMISLLVIFNHLRKTLKSNKQIKE